MRRLRRASTVIVAVACGLLAVSVLSQVAIAQWNEEDLVIGEISVRRIRLAPSEADPAEGLEKVDAVVGDRLHLRAVVGNAISLAAGASAEEIAAATMQRLRVDFFFTERITQEHGLLASQTVFELEPGEQRLPAISVDTAGLTPGFYVFTVAVADGDVSTVAGSGGYIVSRTQEDDEYTVVVAEGARIAELQGTTFPFATCQFGGIQSDFVLDVMNVGTVSLADTSSFSVSAQATIGTLDIPLDMEVDSANLQVPGVFGTTLGLKVTGTQALADALSPSADLLSHFEVLGQFNPNERPFIAITVEPTSGPAQEIILPPGSDEGRRVVFFSELDAWQFPEPTVCGCTESEGLAGAGSCGGVPTSDPAIRPFVRNANRLFHITETASGDQYLHVMDPTIDQSLGEPLLLKTSELSLGVDALTDPVVRFETETTEEGATISWYYVYVGASDETVHVYTLKETVIQDTRAFEWIMGPAGDVADWSSEDSVVSSTASEEPNTHLRYLEDVLVGNAEDESGDALLVAGDAGVYLLNADTGALLQTLTTESVSRDVAVAEGFVWFSDDNAEHVTGVEIAVEEQGSAAASTCSTIDGDDTVTTAVVYSEGHKTIFWGDGEGNVYALPVSSPETQCTQIPVQSSIFADPIAGIALAHDVTSDGDTDPVVFVTSVEGVVSSIEYNASGPGFDQDSVRTSNVQGGLEIDGNEHLGLVFSGGRFVPSKKGSVLSPARDGKFAPPVVLNATDPDLVLLTGQFKADSDTEAKDGTRWALVALQKSTDDRGDDIWAIYKANTWAEDVEYVLKLGDGEGPILEPTAVNEHLFIVTVPGDRLYALDSGREDVSNGN